MYVELQALSERSAMVSRALEYIGDIMKHIKPSLVSKTQDGLQLVYWAVGEETRRINCRTVCVFYEFLAIHKD